MNAAHDIPIELRTDRASQIGKYIGKAIAALVYLAVIILMIRVVI
jgi:hypothetical protein